MHISCSGIHGVQVILVDVGGVATDGWPIVIASGATCRSRAAPLILLVATVAGVGGPRWPAVHRRRSDAACGLLLSSRGLVVRGDIIFPRAGLASAIVTWSPQWFQRLQAATSAAWYKKPCESHVVELEAAMGDSSFRRGSSEQWMVTTICAAVNFARRASLALLH